MAKKYRLMISRQVGFNSESPDMGTWLGKLGYQLALQGDIDVSFHVAKCALIPMCRNNAVRRARQIGATHLLMVDPDMAPDWYWERQVESGVPGAAKPFWQEAWPFMLSHYPCVVAAPACGNRPRMPVQTFVESAQHPGKIVRLTRELAEKADGWWSVSAVGTAVMMMDMRVFDKLTHPYFADAFQTNEHTELLYSHDVRFCLQCRAAGIPVYVNFSCWSRHWQMGAIDKPGWVDPFEDSQKGIGEAMEPYPKSEGQVDVPKLVEPGAGDAVPWGAAYGGKG